MILAGKTDALWFWEQVVGLAADHYAKGLYGVLGTVVAAGLVYVVFETIRGRLTFSWLFTGMGWVWIAVLTAASLALLTRLFGW